MSRLITIMTQAGPQTVPAEVVRGGLFGVVNEGESYHVTHIPSGGAMPGVFRTKSGAIRSARFLTDLLANDLFFQESDFETMSAGLKRWQKENPDLNAALKAHWEEIDNTAG